MRVRRRRRRNRPFERLSSAEIRFSPKDLHFLQVTANQLRHQTQGELVMFAFCQKVVVGRQVYYLPQRWYAPKISDYQVHTLHSCSMGLETYRRLYIEAKSGDFALLHIHSHPSSPLTFSGQDRMGQKEHAGLMYSMLIGVGVDLIAMVSDHYLQPLGDIKLHAPPWQCPPITIRLPPGVRLSPREIDFKQVRLKDKLWLLWKSFCLVGEHILWRWLEPRQTAWWRE